MRDFLALLNTTVLKRNRNDQPINKFFIGDVDGKVSTKFLTFPEHFGIDPTICLLCKTSGNSSNFNYKIAEQVYLDSTEVSDILKSLFS
jgi:hypothetical protein